MIRLSLFAAFFITLTSPASARIIADCGPSVGKSYYLTPKHEGWVDDRVSGGRTLFDLADDGKLNVLFKDATGAIIDATQDGARVILLKSTEGHEEIAAFAAYPSTGVVESYSIIKDRAGNRTLLWTSMKNRVGALGVSKVSSFISVCS